MVTDLFPDAAPEPASGTPPTDSPALYTARVENTAGTSGRVLVRDAPAVEIEPVGPGAEGDIALPTGGPRSTATGFNPEQFLAMAWSTCLGETLRVVLAEQRLEHESSVSVEVELHRDPTGGFRFVPRALVRIKDLDPDRARELVRAAHSRCPVSKLLQGTGEPAVELVVEH